MKCLFKSKKESSAHRGREVVHREIPTQSTTYETHGDNKRVIIVDENSLSMELKAFALKTSSLFEGSHIAGNFDGQGISFGLLNWCIGQGSFQKNILGPAVERLGHVKVNSLFPKPITPIMTMTIKDAIKYSLQMQNAKGLVKKSYTIKSDWRLGFDKLHELTKDIEQVNASEAIARKALKYCIEYNLTSVRSFCFFFDVVVQNGSMKGVHLSANEVGYLGGVNNLINDVDTSKDNSKLWSDVLDLKDALKDQYSITALAEMSVMAKLIIKRATKNKWRSDVINRKGAVIMGIGWVHGKLAEMNYNEFQVSSSKLKAAGKVSAMVFDSNDLKNEASCNECGKDKTEKCFCDFEEYTSNA